MKRKPLKESQRLTRQWFNSITNNKIPGLLQAIDEYKPDGAVYNFLYHSEMQSFWERVAQYDKKEIAPLIIDFFEQDGMHIGSWVPKKKENDKVLKAFKQIEELTRKNPYLVRSFRRVLQCFISKPSDWSLAYAISPEEFIKAWRLSFEQVEKECGDSKKNSQFYDFTSQKKFSKGGEKYFRLRCIGFLIEDIFGKKECNTVTDIFNVVYRHLGQVTEDAVKKALKRPKKKRED